MYMLNMYEKVRFVFFLHTCKNGEKYTEIYLILAEYAI